MGQRKNNIRVIDQAAKESKKWDNKRAGDLVAKVIKHKTTKKYDMQNKKQEQVKNKKIKKWRIKDKKPEW